MCLHNKVYVLISDGYSRRDVSVHQNREDAETLAMQLWHGAFNEAYHFENFADLQYIVSGDDDISIDIQECYIQE